MKAALWTVIALAALVFGMPANATSIAQAVRATLSLPNERLSYKRAKLDFDRIIVRESGGPDAANEVTKLADAARRLAPSANDIDKLKAVRQVLYDAGEWNGNRPFSYDQSDPYGHDLNNKLLATYLRTRRGNCVSMPILHLLVAEGLGLNVSLSTAPLHVFVRYTNPVNGRGLAIEPTSGGHPAREIWYREQMGVTDAQVASGIYLSVLTKRETIAVMASTVTEWLLREKRYQEVIDVTDVLLQHYPKDIHALLARGTAHALLMQAEFVDMYPRPDLIPVELQPRYRMLVEQNKAAFAQAEAWGWTPAER